MIIHDLITFCQNNRVEVSLGFDPVTEHIVVKLRRGNLFQVDYYVMGPNEVNNRNSCENVFKYTLNDMLRQLDERDKQLKTMRTREGDHHKKVYF